MTPAVRGILLSRAADLVVALLVLLFVYTASSKFLDWQHFTGTMLTQPLPRWLARSLPWTIPAAEIVAAGFLLYAPTKRKGLFLALFLLIAFTLYIATILLHLLPGRTPCSCGGIFRHLTWQQHFWVNVGLIGLTAFALAVKLQKRVFSPLNPSI
jgi:hypothetical protein